MSIGQELDKLAPKLCFLETLHKINASSGYPISSNLSWSAEWLFAHALITSCERNADIRGLRKRLEVPPNFSWSLQVPHRLTVSSLSRSKAGCVIRLGYHGQFLEERAWYCRSETGIHHGRQNYLWYSKQMDPSLFVERVHD